MNWKEQNNAIKVVKGNAGGTQAQLKYQIKENGEKFIMNTFTCTHNKA